MNGRQARLAAVVAAVALMLILFPVRPAWASAAVTGRVVSTLGGPIAGATVTVPDRAGASTTTADDGTFVLDVGLPVEIEVRASGFATARVAATTSPVEVVLVPVPLVESVLVTGGLPPATELRDPLTGTATLRADDLQRLPAVTLDESLKVVSGFSLFRRSSSRTANPTTHGVTMRGLSASGASRGLVVLDGTPLNDGFGGWVTWTRVPELALAGVEIDRGPQGDAYGSDALGGLIRLVPATSGPVTFVARAGTHGVGGADASAGRAWTGTRVFAATSWFRTDGTIPVEPGSRGPVDEPTDVTWANGLGRVEVRRDAISAVVTAWGGRDDRGNGTELQRNRMTGGTVGATVTGVVSDSTLVSGRLSYSPNTFTQTFTAVAADRASERLISSQRTETGTTRALVELARAVPRATVYVRGALTRASADFSDARSSGTQTSSLRDDSESVSVQVEAAPAARVTASAGVRHEWRAAPESGDDRDGATVGHARASVDLRSGVVLRGGVATSHRWPTLNELVRDFQVGAVRTLANRDLAPERARSFEGGIGYSPDTRMTLAATVFRTMVDDAIANVTLPSVTGIVRQRRNAGESKATGLELDAQARAADVQMRGSVTITNATFDSPAEPAIDGNRLPQVPRVSAAFWLEAPLRHGVRGVLTWQGVSSQFDDDRNTYELGAASQVGVAFDGPAGPVRWSVSVENLFDNRIEVGRTPLVTLAPGRELRVAVTWRR
ncbi:MAG: TonB-dependent receptor [Vicinamibacterales bacterium]